MKRFSKNGLREVCVRPFKLEQRQGQHPFHLDRHVSDTIIRAKA
jgi:hypothetical protein